MTKWEYLNVTIKTGIFHGGPEMVTEKLCEYGKNGWELVNFQLFNSSNLMCFVFKRPLEEK